MENAKKIISLENLLQDSWRIYRDNFKKLVTISILAFLPLLLIMVLSWLPNSILWINLILIIAAIYAGTIGSVMLVLLLKNRETNFRELMEKAKPLFWKFLLVSLLSGVLLILLYLALIIPGIIFSIFWALASYTLIFEGKTGISALRRSRELINGNWWAVFARYLVYILIYVILSTIISVLFISAKDGSAFFYVGQIINYMASFIFMPFSIVFFFVLYRNLKAIKS